MLYIIYFNLKNGVSQKEYANKLKEIMDYLEGKVEGFRPWKFYRHHNGANPRYYQMHMKMKDYGTWDRFFAFIENDARAKKLMQEWRKLLDLNTHFDEFLIEIPL